MPRHPRLFVPGATYHVYCRVARGEFVLDDPSEAEEFIEAARRVTDLDGVKVLAWCLMGNHYHLVIKTGSIPLWRTILRLQATVARKFNRRRRFLGRLWQSRYRARIIDSTVSRWLNHGVTRQREDADFRERMNRLDRQISSASCDNEAMRRVTPG